MPAHRVVSERQFERLVAFLEDHRELAKGRLSNRGSIEKQAASLQWAELAMTLNALGDGTTKTGKKWRDYWNEKKYAVRKKASELRAHGQGTGGDPPKKWTLTVLEERIINIIGQEPVYGNRTPTPPLPKIVSSHSLHSAPQEPLVPEKCTTATTVTLGEAMKIGFIGGGRLAFALANGFISAGLAKPDEITASCHPSDVTSAEAFKGLGATALFENKSVVERSEVVIVSVKPDVVGPALKEVSGLAAAKNKLFISVAMGVSTATIEKVLPPEARVIRVMPNTPALVKEGAAALSRGSKATTEDAKLASKLFQAVGTCDEVPEYQMDAVTALSGSGPAYVYMLIESLADGGVRCGLPRDLALRLATQTTLGSAAMLKNGEHPAALKDNVTSPAGSTAEGTYHLERNGFRSAVIGAVGAAADRCKVVNKLLNN